MVRLRASPTQANQPWLPEGSSNRRGVHNMTMGVRLCCLGPSSLLWCTPLPFPLPQGGLFYSFFKRLVGKTVAVELKNDVELTGKLHSVDQYLNIKLEDVEVVRKERYPQLVSVGCTYYQMCCVCGPRLSRWTCCASPLTAGSQECVHSWFSSALRPDPSESGRHPAAAGLCTQGAAG
jgi:small nuclear ribonucleoprotein (snRNP)-like protein